MSDGRMYSLLLAPHRPATDSAVVVVATWTRRTLRVLTRVLRGIRPNNGERHGKTNQPGTGHPQGITFTRTKQVQHRQVRSGWPEDAEDECKGTERQGETEQGSLNNRPASPTWGEWHDRQTGRSKSAVPPIRPERNRWWNG